MAMDLFLEIKGVEGESLKQNHEGHIEIHGFSMGITQSGSFHELGAGGGAGKAEIQDLTVSKSVDKSSPLLFKMSATGEHIDEVIITAQKAGGEAIEYYKIIMTHVIVSALHNSGSTHDDRVDETVTFNCAKMEFKYKEQLAGGGEGPVVAASYDMQRNVAS